jgi:RNA polymerase sigma-70 factor (ECF subfamily)
VSYPSKGALIGLDALLVNRSVCRAEVEAETERRCVLRAMRGEPGAFGLLYQRHVDAVYNYVHFRVRDEATAEDLTQDVFTSAFKGMAQLKAEDKFKHWLLRIAHNRVLNHWRAQSVGPERSTLPLDDDGAAAWPGPPEAALADDGQMAAAEIRLAVGDVLAALDRLTDLQQQVIALRFVAGLSVAETAAVMERSNGAVKNLQHHALAALRRAALGPEPLGEHGA